MNETKTYALDFVVEQTGAPSVDWIRRKLNAGLVPGRRAGRKWRMTESDMASLVDFMASPARTVTAAPAEPLPPAGAVHVTGLTPRSRRNLQRKTA